MKYLEGFPGGSDGKESTWNTGDVSSIPGSGRAPGEGNGYPLQYSRLENFMDRGARQAIVHGSTMSWTQMSNFHFTSLPFESSRLHILLKCTSNILQD